MKNPKVIQIAVIAGVMLLVGFLYAKDIKSLAETKKDEAAAPAAAMPNTAKATILSLEEISATAKNLISNASTKEINALEKKFAGAKGADKLNSAKVLAQKWEDLEQAAPSGLYLEVVAQEQPSLKNWLNAGEMFIKGFDSTQDSVLRPMMLEKANGAFQKALALDSTSLDAKTGLGTTIVNGLGNVMQGITMLLDVVKKDPKNIKANMVLGLFSMQSGQFDKAVQRFETVIAEKPTPDAYFYLATAFENLKEKQKAIDAYKASKRLAANPTLSSFIDKKVAELEK